MSSGTGNLLEGTALGALLAGNGNTSGFSIDYERVPQAIADLEHAAKFFRRRAETALRLANIAAPGTDGVSLNAVAQIGKWAADEGVNNLYATLEAGATQLEELAHKLRTDLARRPCELLTAPQAKEFGLDVPPVQYDAALGQMGCEWTGTSREGEVLRQVIINTFTNNPTLDVVYNREHKSRFFELTEISGYPSIVTRSNPDLPHCHIDVKAAERQSFSVGYDSKLFDKNPQQACVVAKQIAAAVLMNLPLKG